MINDRVLQSLLVGLDSVLWDQLQIIADRCEDLGLDDLAWAYRIIASEKWMPLRHSDVWYWRRDELRQNWRPLSHQLPIPATAELAIQGSQEIGCLWNESSTMAKAYHRAACALARTKEASVNDMLPFDGLAPVTPLRAIDFGGGRVHMVADAERRS